MPAAAPIPIIDISAQGADQAKTAKDLVDAAVEYGFVYIRSLGQNITADQVGNAFNLRCKIEKNNQGWSGMHSETLDPESQRVGDFKEGFNFGPFQDDQATQPIPQSMVPHQAELASFRDACHSLCRKLLLLFGVGLGVDPPDFFTKAHLPEEPSGSILRFLYYPPPAAISNACESDVRAGAHSDYGSVTLLFRLKGQAGLELLSPRTNSWQPVPVCPPGTENDPSPPILVNIGDLLEYWTNGLLRSTVHRVTDGTSGSAAGLTEGESITDPRYSLVFFCHPANNTLLGAIPSERVRNYRGGIDDAKTGNRNERKTMTAVEHLQMRLQATYLQLYNKDKKEQ